MPEPGTSWSGPLWAREVAFLMQLQVVAGGGRDFERRFSGGGNSDIPRDFMKISVAECDIQE